MINTYTVHQRTIEVDKLGTPINLWFFGDVHRDTESCDVDRWKWFLVRAKADPKDTTYFFGMGDYHDFASTREKKQILASLHENTIDDFNHLATKKNRAFMLEAGFMRGRVLGLIEGNHHWAFSNGTTTTHDLCERLETEYLGWLCHYTLSFKFKDRGTTRAAVHFVLCHGRAGGKTFGITINQVGDLKQIFPVADVYCQAHDHQRGAWPVSVLVPTNGAGKHALKQKRQFLCRSGSFKKAYLPGKSTYEVGRLLRPSDLGALKLVINFHRDCKDGKDRLITDIEARI